MKISAVCNNSEVPRYRTEAEVRVGTGGYVGIGIGSYDWRW